MNDTELVSIWDGRDLLPDRPEHTAPTWQYRDRTKYSLAERHKTGAHLQSAAAPVRKQFKPHQRWDEAVKDQIRARVRNGESLYRVCKALQVSISTARDWVGQR